MSIYILKQYLQAGEHFTPAWVNSLRAGDAFMHHVTGPLLALEMAKHLSRAKPLPEVVMTKSMGHCTNITIAVKTNILTYHKKSEHNLQLTWKKEA